MRHLRKRRVRAAATVVGLEETAEGSGYIMRWLRKLIVGLVALIVLSFPAYAALFQADYLDTGDGLIIFIKMAG